MITFLKRFAVFVLYTLLFSMLIIVLIISTIIYLVSGRTFVNWFCEKVLSPIDEWIDRNLNDEKGTKRRADELTGGPFPGK